MDSSMVTRHTQKRAVAVEVDAVDVGGLRAPPQLSQDVAAQGVEHADQGAFGAGSRHLGSLDIELDDRQTGVMSCNIQRRAVSRVQIYQGQMSRLNQKRSYSHMK